MGYVCMKRIVWNSYVCFGGLFEVMCLKFLFKCEKLFKNIILEVGMMIRFFVGIVGIVVIVVVGVLILNVNGGFSGFGGKGVFMCVLVEFVM